MALLAVDYQSHMRFLVNKIKSLLPRIVREPVSIYRSVRRNYAIDTTLTTEHGCDLGWEYIKHLVVVPSRLDMLRQFQKGTVAAEIGVALWDYSREILDIVKPRELHLIDAWMFSDDRYGQAALKTVESKFSSERAAGIVHIHCGLTVDVLSQIPDGYFDWVYIDASHDYESVRADLAACERKIKPDGILSGDDYTLWSRRGIARFGVVEAVNEFCMTRDWEFVTLTNERHRHLSFALKRRNSVSTG